MGRTAAGGAFWIGLAQAVRIFLTIATTVVVARILSPHDYGIMAMVAPITAFLLMFQNLGLSHAAVQAKTLSPEQSNALFWLNMAGSAVIAATLVAASPLVGRFYGEAAAGHVMAASAINVLLSASALQHSALLNRALRFRALGLIDIVAAVVGAGVTITAAVMLRSYWALWLGALVGTTMNLLLVWSVSPWRPSLRVTIRGSGKLVRFGGSITGFRLLNYLSRNMDNVLIGRVWGAGPLGLYDRSYRLMMFPLQNVNAPLSKVMLPVFSRLQDQPERLRRSFLLTLRLLMIAILPGVAVAGATSEQLIPFLLSERWAAAAPIFTWLSLAALLQPLSNSTGWLFIVTGRGRALVLWGAFSSAVTIIAFLVGVREGPLGVAIAYFISTAAKFPILLLFCVKGTAIRTRDLYSVAIPSFIAAAVTWLLASWLMASMPIIPTLSLGLPAAYAVCILVHSLTRRGRDAMREIWRIGASTGTAWLRSFSARRSRTARNGAVVEPD